MYPASVGILALSETHNAKFNLSPLSGGKNTITAAVTGEVNFSVLTCGSVAVRIRLRDSFKNVQSLNTGQGPIEWSEVGAVCTG